MEGPEKSFHRALKHPISWDSPHKKEIIINLDIYLHALEWKGFLFRGGGAAPSLGSENAFVYANFLLLRIALNKNESLINLRVNEPYVL